MRVVVELLTGIHRIMGDLGYLDTLAIFPERFVDVDLGDHSGTVVLVAHTPRFLLYREVPVDD